MNRMTLGAVLGGAAVYLFDPESGEERRERLSSLWRENRDSVAQAGRAASQAAESARPMARRMTNAVRRRDWTETFDRGRLAVGATTLVGAAVIGGTLVYLLDPVKGSERRHGLLSSWHEHRQSTMEAVREVARQTGQAVKPHADRVGAQMAGAVDGVRSRVR